MFVPFFPICLLELSLFSSIDAASEDHGTFTRLPTHIEPVVYRIELITHLEKTVSGFEGHTDITIKVNNESDNIILHAHNLHIHGIKLFRNTLGSIPIQNFTIDNRTDFLTIRLNQSLSIGIYRLTFNYSNYHNNEDSLGFLQRLYSDSGNQEVLMAFTNLQPTGARRVFPCWDEPGIKANFTIIVEHHFKYQVLSNMSPAYRSYDEKNKTTVTTYFPETPKMSTYLVAIVICNYKHKESNNGLIRLHARHDIIDKMSYLLESAEKIIAFMDNYTGISYKSFGFGKLDIVMVPYIGNRVAGMENWGLVTLQELEEYTDDNAAADTSDKEWLTMLIAHECAHQWFGNLVTIQWWTDLWINEGIATYFHYFIIDQIKSSWYIMDKFVADDEMNVAIERKMKPETIDANVESKIMNDTKQADIDHIYFRSAHLIRMIAQIVGNEKIQQVWRNYLRKNAFGAVVPNSIIDEFARAADIEIRIFREIFNNWMNTTGLPVLDVKRNYDTGEVTVRQQRLLFPSNSSISLSEKYWIPINYVTENDLNFDVINDIIWMRPNDTTLKFDGFPMDKWVIFNKQQFGYYCVNYDERNWELIIKALKSGDYSKIHVRNRLQLTHDAFLLLRTGRMSHGLVLSLLSYLERETDIIPWIPAWEGVKFLTNYLRNSKYLRPFKKYAAHLMNRLIEHVRFDDLPSDSHLSKYYRYDMLALACELGAESSQRVALTKLIQWINYPTKFQLPPKTENIILCYGLRNAEDAVWNHLWQKWLDNSDHDLLDLLGCTSNQRSLKSFLSSVAAHDRKSGCLDLPEAIKAVASGSENGVKIAIDFISEHLRSIIHWFRGQTIIDLISHITKELDEKDEYKMDFIVMRYHHWNALDVDPKALKAVIFQASNRFELMIPDYEMFFPPGVKFS